MLTEVTVEWERLHHALEVLKGRLELAFAETRARCDELAKHFVRHFRDNRVKPFAPGGPASTMMLGRSHDPLHIEPQGLGVPKIDENRHLPGGLPTVLASRQSTPTSERERAIHAAPRTADWPTVVHVVVAGECGGAERFLVELASRPHQTQAHHVIALMTPSARLARLFREAGLRVHDRGRVRESPISYLWRSLAWADVRWLADVMRREHASIAHLHTFQSHVVGTRAAGLAGARVLRTEHDTRYFVDPSCSVFTRWSLRRADATIAVSSSVERFMRTKLRDVMCPVRTIRNGVDLRYFTPPQNEPSSRPFTFGVLCRLEPVKQVHLVLRALARVEGAHLSILGDGSELPRLRRLADTLLVADRVTFHGFKSDPREVMRTIDVVVSASSREALGLSLLEAQAMGRPVIAFGVGGVPEVVVDGLTGWVLRDRSVTALATCMAEVRGAPSRAREMGINARRYVESEHTIDRMCSSYADVYAQLGARAGRPKSSLRIV
jgi:glycosyltransferase involved in cell wall biosynthesis